MKLSKIVKTVLYILCLLSISSCGRKESPLRTGKFKVIDIKDDIFLSATNSSMLSCQKDYVMYDDIIYTKTDSNIKIGDSISLMYVPKTESYYIKDNFPRNYNSVENSEINHITTIISLMLLAGLCIGMVWSVYMDIREYYHTNL